MSIMAGRQSGYTNQSKDDYEPTAASDSRARQRLGAYGLTPAEYAEMELRQDGRCAICDRGGLELVIDHDHADGHVRGLLCRRCNATLGWLRDEPELAERMAEYLREARITRL